MHILYGLGNPLRKNMQYVCISTITFILLHKHVCLQGESVLSISFPALGTPDFTDPPTKANPEDVDAAGSMFWPLQAVYLGHPRLPCIPSANRKYHSCVQIQESVEEHSRQKRLEGGNQCAHFQGQKHQESLYCKSLMNERKKYVDPFRKTCLRMEVQTTLRRPNPITSTWIIWDLGWAAAACRSASLFERVEDIFPLLQVTFQAVNVDEARWLYDQLTPITPILLALSASTPIFRAKLADIDCRWDIISAVSC